METSGVTGRGRLCAHLALGNCNICVERRILVINKLKRDEIFFKPKVLDQEKLY
jgi:hypothetical protein